MPDAEEGPEVEEVKKITSKIVKRKLPPQTIIDQFWKEYTSKHSGRVLNILPPSSASRIPTTPPKISKGEPLSKSYDDAVKSCKDLVSTIVKQCRRANQAYTDNEFDMRLGAYDTLVSLSSTNTSHFNPGSVKRVRDIFHNPKFFVDGATANDVQQGKLGNCWMAAAASAASNKAGLIEKLCPVRDEEVGVYGFVFYRDGEWRATVVDDHLFLTREDYAATKGPGCGRKLLGSVEKSFEDEVATEGRGIGSFISSLFFGKCQNPNETWFPLLEKAYAKAHGDYSAIEGGQPGDALEDFTGGVTTKISPLDILDKTTFWKQLVQANREHLFVCSTPKSVDGGERGLMGHHAYSVVKAVETHGKRFVLLRNPWGRGEWMGPWSDGSKEWTFEWMRRLKHRFGDDGYFWMLFEDLLERYQLSEKTRLFSSNWKVAQKWTSFNSRFVAEYQKTKFSFTLTSSSLVVLVLSTPDYKYFRPFHQSYLGGTYLLVTKLSSSIPATEIGGPYHSGRSISTELYLEKGTYLVSIKLHLYLDRTKQPFDNIIRENIAFRSNKLRQTGLRYDEAHHYAKIEDQAYELELARRTKEAKKEKVRKQIMTVKKADRERVNKGRRKMREKKLKRIAKKKTTGGRQTRSVTLKTLLNLIDADNDSDASLTSLTSTISSVSSTTIQEKIDGVKPKKVPSGKDSKEGTEDIKKDGSIIPDWNAGLVLGLRVYVEKGEVELSIVRPEWEDILGDLVEHENVVA